MSPRDDDLPRRIPAMWRALKRALSGRAALADGLVRIVAARGGAGCVAGVVDEVAGEWSDCATIASRRSRGDGAGGLSGRHVVSPRDQRPRAAAVPRPGDDRARIARGGIAGVGRDASRITNVPSIWIGLRCCAIRCSCWTTCTCRCSPPAAGFCGWRDRGVARCRFTRSLALLVVFALPTVLTSTWRPGVERAMEERGASANRLARHLFNVATTAPPGKEVRVTRIGDRLAKERREAWERWYRPVAAARGAARHGTRWRGRFSERAMWARWCSLRWCESDAGTGVAGAGSGCAIVRLYRRDRRRNWIPARLLAGWFAADGVAGGLRCVADGACRHICAGASARTASASSMCHLLIREPSVSCSRT